MSVMEHGVEVEELGIHGDITQLRYVTCWYFLWNVQNSMTIRVYTVSLSKVVHKDDNDTIIISINSLISPSTPKGRTDTSNYLAGAYYS